MSTVRTAATLDLGARPINPHVGWRLAILREGSSSIVPLPPSGAVTIGRAPEAHVSIDEPSLSRLHARLTMMDAQVAIVDLGSRNGTLVNGQKITAARELMAGDVVTVGTVSLVLYGGGSSRPVATPVTLEELRRRIADELDRGRHYERPTAVVAIQFAEPPGGSPSVLDPLRPLLRGHDVLAWSDPTQLLLVLPEVTGDEARELADELLEALGRPGARAGLSVSPVDAIEPESLLAAARAAASAAQPGEVRTAAQQILRVALGQYTWVLADPAMFALHELVKRLAPSDLTVLISGETGSGKELVARAVHHYSKRRDKPFVAINCAAIPETLLESELFGHERGAFTGATAAKQGLFETADGGTVFLDEVGELSPSAQAKLLRAVEARQITRIGDARERPINVRLVAATHRDLREDAKAKRFREDLLFRLAAATIALPPLRDRQREIPILAQEFCEEFIRGSGRPVPSFSMASLHALVSHPWPGNVRELRNAVTVAAATAEGDMIEAWHLPAALRAHDPGDAGDAQSPAPTDASPKQFRKLSEEIRELEIRRMKEALEATGNVQKYAAQKIGMPLRTFVLKVKQYALNKPSSGTNSNTAS